MNHFHIEKHTILTLSRGENMERKDAYLWLKSISGISTKTIEKINNQVNNIENVIEFSDEEIYNLKNINLNIKESIVKYKSHSYLEELKVKIYERDVKYICIEDKEYPERLKHIHNPPSANIIG